MIKNTATKTAVCFIGLFVTSTDRCTVVKKGRGDKASSGFLSLSSGRGAILSLCNANFAVNITNFSFQVFFFYISYGVWYTSVQLSF
jgi:hypothetical protein